jgi:RNA polymerase sigma-70 factor, ECF subfamily
VSASEDQADIEKVLSGDIAAFEGIVRRWQRPLINLAHRFCRDRGRAEEMAQEAFLRAYRKPGLWRKDSVFSSWLFSLATNLYRSELRRIPIRTAPLDEIAEPSDPHVRDGELEVEERERLVRQAVAALPAKYRDAVIVYYFQGMDISAAARSLGLTEGTLKSRLFRGREVLRSKLPRLFRGAVLDGGVMRKDELDRILSEEEILPSSGFAGAVMDAVRREATAPPPIAFPWKRAWPGLMAGGLTVALVLFAAVALLFRGPTEVPVPLPPWTTAVGSLLGAVVNAGGLWALGALLVSYVCVKLAMIFGARRV